VFLVGLLILLYQKRYRAMGIYLLIAIVTVVSYFHGYITTASHPSLTQALAHPIQIIIYFFTLIGAPVGSFHFAWLAKYVGFVVFAYFLYLTYKSYFKKNVVVYSFFLFLFGTVFTIAVSRSGFGLEQAFASKYMIVSILFYVLGYISLIENFSVLKGQKYVLGFIGLALCFNLASYYANINDIKAHNESLVHSAEEWKKSGAGLVYPDKDRANMLLLKAGERGIYELESVCYQC